MATSKRALYKVKQQLGRKAVRNRGEVLWVSCQLVAEGYFGLNQMKQKIQGTRVGSFK